MKRCFVLLLAVLSLMTVASCTDNIVIPTTSDDGVIKEITAYADGYYPTKTSIVDNSSGGKDVIWKAGNAVSLFFISGNNGGSKFTTDKSGPIATFTGTISSVIGDLSETGGTAYYWATYPYGSTVSCDGTGIITALRSSQVAYVDNVDDDLLVTIGRSPNPAIYFRNTYTMIEFTLSQDDITKITFMGNNDEKVAGEFKASFDANNKVVSTPTKKAVKKIVITPAESSSFVKGKKYYFVFLPGTFSKGYSLMFTRNDGYVATFTRSNSWTPEVGKFYTMTNKDNGLAFGPPAEMVDLGLPSGVKWANMNIGAFSPSSEGTWFAFGDIIGSSQYEVYDETVYMNLIGGSGAIAGSGDPLVSYRTLPPSHDAATVLMGENWRTPSSNDFCELFDHCDVSVDGSVVRFVSQINGAELLFLRGEYWCSQLEGDAACCAFPEDPSTSWAWRRATMQIRGVYGLPKHRPTLGEVTINDITNTGALISSNITNDGGAEISERGFYVKIGSSSNYDVIAVPGSGVGEFSLSLSGLSHATQYSVAAYATNSVGTSQSSWKSFRTDRNPIPAEYKGTLDGHDWVDIGLRKSHIDSNIVPGSSEDRIIAFATVNIGASSPDNTGYYFRWGEQMGWDISVQDGNSSIPSYSAVQRDRDGNVTSEVWSSSTFGSNYLDTDLSGRAAGLFQDVTRKTDLKWYSFTYGDAATYNWGDNWMTPSISIFKAMLSVDQSTIHFGDVYTKVNPLTFGAGANSLSLTISKETINGHPVLLLINDETGAYVIMPTYGGYTHGNYVLSYGTSGTGYYQTSSIRLDDKRNVPIYCFDCWSSTYWFSISSIGNKYEGRAVRPVTELTLDNKQPLYTDEDVPETIEEVDLGLSVKWASMNLGAKNKYDCGLFYRFGELTGHGCFDTFDRSWSGYFASIGGNGASSSDCGGSEDPLADYKGSVIPSEFDAAHETLGGTWRMPTRQEIQELMNNCTITLLSVSQTYSICAMKATSKVNGNSIIIPLSGYYYPGSSGFSGTNRSGCFWSSSMGVNYVDSGWNVSKAWYGVVSSSNYTLNTESLDRNYAIPIRAVKE